MKKTSWPLFCCVVLLALLSTLAGCGRESKESETPTAPPEPAGNQIVYTALYRAVLGGGETMAGTQLEYVGQDDDRIHVRIDGQDAYKKVGDSFNWRGSPADGVELHYKLRVVGVYLDVFQAWGNVDITVLDPAPVVAELPKEAPLSFSAAVATYAVKMGELIPGTTYSYLGKTDKGAKFGGVEGYAFREIADSLDWSGQVRNNVYVDLTMRVSSIKDEEVTLVGTATIWVFP